MTGQDDGLVRAQGLTRTDPSRAVNVARRLQALHDALVEEMRTAKGPTEVGATEVGTTAAVPLGAVATTVERAAAES